MKAKKIKEGIYWVGAVDWNLRNFHGYLTQKGSSYNAYLIVDEKVTLIDTVKSTVTKDLLQRIKSVIDPKQIDFIVVNHVEMDHSGSLPEVMSLAPKAKIITNKAGKMGLEKHFAGNWDYHLVESGDELSLGKRTLQFVQTPMVHWPDNMFSYCPQEKVLFSNDAFGQHLAGLPRMDADYPLGLLMGEAKKYYANIVLPYGQQVQKALQAAKDLQIDYICPSHGVIWHKYIQEIVGSYQDWSTNQTKESAVVIYDTMWGSTKLMAESLVDSFEEQNISVELVNLQCTHISDIMTKLVDARYICIGSPTLNNNILPTVAAFLCYLSGLAPQNRIGLAFGSFGWGGQSVPMIEAALQKVGFQMMKSHKKQYVPNSEVLLQMGREFTEELKTIK